LEEGESTSHPDRRPVRRRLFTAGAGTVLGLAATAVATQEKGEVAKAAPSNDPWFDATAFGAKGDGVTDDTAAIQAALNTAGAGNYPLVGGIVFLPRGTYMISSRLVIPWRVTMLGVGRDATTIKALDQFPAGTELVRIGDMSGQIGVASRIENLSVDCANVNGSIGIYTERANEQCGAFRCLIRNFRQYGIWINQPGSGAPPQHWTLDELEIFTGPKTPASAIGIAVTMRSYAMPIRQISRVTVFASSYTPLTTAVKLDGISAGRVSDIHVEGAVTGLLVGSDRNCWGTAFYNIDGMDNVTNLLVWAKGEQSLIAIGLADIGAKNTLVDNITGNTLSGPVAFYSVGQGAGGDNAVLTTDYNIPTRLRHVQVLGDLRRSVTWPSFSTSFTPDARSGEVQQLVLTGNITVNNPVNGAAGQKLLFTFMQDGSGDRTITYGPKFMTGGVVPVNTSPWTTTIDQFVCLDGTHWRLCSRVTGQEWRAKDS
jgi:Pectate lyase superfamily protein